MERNQKPAPDSLRNFFKKEKIYRTKQGANSHGNKIHLCELAVEACYACAQVRLKINQNNIDFSCGAGLTPVDRIPDGAITHLDAKACALFVSDGQTNPF